MARTIPLTNASFSGVAGESLDYRVNARVPNTRADVVVYRIGYYQVIVVPLCRYENDKSLMITP